jgi:hypothetical protein
MKEVKIQLEMGAYLLRLDMKCVNADLYADLSTCFLATKNPAASFHEYSFISTCEIPSILPPLLKSSLLAPHN